MSNARVGRRWSSRWNSQWVAGFVVALVWSVSTDVSADVTVYASRGAEWRFFPGLEEPSPEEFRAWTTTEFDDASWERGPAPFGFGDPPFGTDMGTLDPPMRRNYTTLYLRHEFDIADASLLVGFQADIDYDDGYILWLNGIEVARSNAPLETPFDAVATNSRESGEYEVVDDLPPPQVVLRTGRNVVAVQAFNRSATNADFKIDVELYDPFGPDLSSPIVTRIQPAPGRTVRTLTQVELEFSEAVDGVDAADLLVGDVPAVSVEGTDVGPYVFQLGAAPDGELGVRFSPDHGIVDLSERQNPMSPPEPWLYQVDSTLPEADLVISEFSATGDGAFLDEDREASDWIEVYNKGVTFVDLTGWSLTDDRDTPSRWVFPTLEIAPDERIVVFASGKDRRDPASELHASFQLSSRGEYLGLFDAESPPSVVSEYADRFPEQRQGHSYGLDLVTGEPTYYEEPSPGAANPGGDRILTILSPPIVSVPHGFYDEAVEVTIAAPASDATVIYTVDGSDPTLENGTVYEGPVRVEGTPGRGVVAVRAAAFREGSLPSRTVTRSYVFVEQVLRQPRVPEGFPSRWGTQVADYEVDPDVVDAPVNRDVVRDALLSVPTMSIVTDVDALFGRSGIYANPSASGDQWERAVSCEVMYPDGSSPGFQVDAGLRIQGGSSTSGWKSIKVSMRLRFTGDYGPKKLRFPIFPDTRVDTFDTINLDAHLNLAYTHPDHGQRVRTQLVRDAYVSDLQNALGSNAPHGRFMHLYLNGLYWGLYDIHERPDNAFAAEYFGGDKSEYDAYRHSGPTPIDGTAQSWRDAAAQARANLRDPNEFLRLGELLDLPDFCDYMLVNFFTGNTDWPHHNWYATGRPGGGKLRFHSWDAEHVLKDLGQNSTGFSNTGTPAEFLSRLRSVPEFQLLFADRVHRAFSRGGPMYVNPESPAVDAERPENNRAATLYRKRIDEILPAMILESARWGDARRAQPYTVENEFMTELRFLENNYFPRRTGVVLGQLRAARLYPRAEAPELNRLGGVVELGTEVALSLPGDQGGAIYVTVDGTDPREFGKGAVSPTASRYEEPIRIDDHTILKARTLDGDEWSALAEAEYTVSDPASGLRFAEIHYNAIGGGTYEFVELINTSELGIGLGGLVFGAGIDYSFPAGATLGAGERYLLVSNAEAFTERYPDVPFDGVYVGSLDDGGERLSIVNHQAQEIVSVRYDDDGFWPLGPDSYGWSLVAVDGAENASGPDAWRVSSEVGGTPGGPDDGVPPGGVIVNEVLTRSTAPLEDAIELHNPGLETIDIGGWFLSDQRGDRDELKKFRIPDGVLLGPGGFAVFYEAQFNADPKGASSFALDGAGDDVYLSSADAEGNLTGYIVGLDTDAMADGASFGVVAASDGAEVGPRSLRARSAVDDPATVDEFRMGDGRRELGADGR